jgi:hypothetical protein
VNDHDPPRFPHLNRNERPMSKSVKWRERQRAYEAGRLHEWHTTQKRQAPTPPPPNPFDAAYSGPSITPEGASWDERGYMRWQLPTNDDRRGHGIPRNP